MKKLILLLFLSFTSFQMQALTFMYNDVLYEVTSPAAVTVKDINRDMDMLPPIKISIPEKVTYSEITYTVTSIGDWAFAGIPRLQQVEIPSSVTTIGNAAFSNCIDLRVMSIPNSVKTIGKEAFARCESLYSCILPDKVKVLEEYLFSNCGNLQSIVIPNSVTNIGTGIFASCSGLLTIDIPNSVEIISESAFSNCGSLVSVTIPASVKQIGEHAFAHCASLGSIIIPNGVKSIEKGTFGYCYNLQQVTLPVSITKIGVKAFAGCNSLTSIKIPKNVTLIDEDAFKGCYRLQFVDIQGPVQTIGFGAFYTCDVLHSPDFFYFGMDKNTYDSGCSGTLHININSTKPPLFYIPAGIILHIPENADEPAYKEKEWVKPLLKTPPPLQMEYDFKADGLYYTIHPKDSFSVILAKPEKANSYSGKITIPSSVQYAGKTYIVKNIDNGVFRGCLKLTSVTIPESIEGIGSSAFYGCVNLQSIQMPTSVKAIGEYAFAYCISLKTIQLPNNVNYIGSLAFLGCTSLTSIVIPDQIKSMDATFYNCHNLQSVVIGNSVKDIGHNTFKDCYNLQCVNLPGSLERIRKSAFRNCESLSEIVIPPSVIKMECDLFNGCRNLTSITVNRLVPPGLECDIVFERQCTLYVPEKALTAYKTSWNGFHSYEKSTSYNEQNDHSGKKIKTYDFVQNGIYYKIISDTAPYSVEVARMADSKRVNFEDVAYMTSEDLTENNRKDLAECAYSGHVRIPPTVDHFGKTYHVTQIGKRAFSGCASLLSVRIPEGVKRIENSAFLTCESLSWVSIPASIEYIGDFAFFNQNLVSVELHREIPPVKESSSFSRSTKARLHVPENAVDAYSSHNDWQDFEEYRPIQVFDFLK